jgi:hypothetical protein
MVSKMDGQTERKDETGRRSWIICKLIFHRRNSCARRPTCEWYFDLDMKRSAPHRNSSAELCRSRLICPKLDHTGTTLRPELLICQQRGLEHSREYEVNSPFALPAPRLLR